MIITCYLVFPSGRLSFSVSIHSSCLPFHWLFSFSWSKSRPQNDFKKLKNSFSPYSYNKKLPWGQSWAEASLSTLSWHYALVCAVVQKYYEFKKKKKRLVLILQSTYFIFMTSKREQTMEQQPHRTCEWTKSNKKSHLKFKLTTHSTVRFGLQTM